MKSRSWAMLFAGLIAALLLLWKLLPGSGGNTVGVYQDGDLVKTIYLPHTGETETFEVFGTAGGNTIEVSKDGVRVVSAGCPDQVCAWSWGIRHGAVHLPAEPAGHPVPGGCEDGRCGRGRRGKEPAMKKLRKLTLAALLTAAGLVVFVIEAQLPPLAAIPGIKPGLSNVFTMLTLFWVGPSWALGTMFVRVSLGCLLTGQTMAFFYSLSGGLLAFFIMWALKKPLGEEKLWVLSAFGAMGHNLGQMAAALFITRTTALLYYLPVLMVSAIGTGIFTGLCAQLVSRRARRAGFLSK